ncbi:diguanylate cyclase [Desulfovibrio sp. X2]|uniref:GGDEF domain-containing protein n=1 Tax=Desulfovibrio sp. X2 TaxID=941449 RepID=UPI000358934C|nr:GGDEF domain-containing protein [Desulfovibrio sp. X2]EPR42354.1 diguanylate cyclase [Desulfovibrio sp. X2]
MADFELLADEGHTLARELERLREQIKLSGSVEENSSKNVLAILRLCPGLILDDWQSLSTSFNLAEWLAMPLQGDLYPQILHLQQRMSNLAHLSDHDALTGLSNRRAFERALDLEIERSRRTHSSISLVVFDIDDFKRINDTYGHPAGDKVLVALSSVLEHEKRRYDMAARTGGEEFSLVLTGAGLLRAQSMVERVLESVRNLRIEHNGNVIGLTCSAGIASYKGRVDMTLAGFVELADNALYEAKRTGKNRYVSAPIPDMAAPLPESTLVHSSEKKFLFTGIK